MTQFCIFNTLIGVILKRDNNYIEYIRINYLDIKTVIYYQNHYILEARTDT